MARVNLDLPSYIINAPTGMKKSSYRSVPDADNWRTSEYANGYSSTDRYHDYEREIPPPREYVEDWGAPVPVPMSGSAKYGPSASSSSRRDTTYAAFPEYNPPWGSDYGFLNDNSNSHHREARSHHRARDDVDRDHDHDQWRPAVPGPAVAVVEPETHGWDTRDAGWVPRKPSMTDEDRKWEPAPSWKPTHVQDSGWNRATSKKAKNTAETDWRNRERDRDRDDLNNWTRRSDSSSSKHGHGHGHGHGRRKQSPQRTRSPAESTHSYYSRGRSRSPASPPPQKRPRHDDTTSSPYRRRSPSPTSPRASRKKRGRSISSVSSRSSRSPSPPVVSKPHRLPSASQPVIKYPQQPQPQAIPEQQPTTKSKKKKNKNKRNGAMAPPNALPLSIPAKPTFYPEQANPISGFDADEASSRVFVPKKGFKPIGAPATSSSLKMFFPKDDDDVSMPSSALRAPLPEKPRWWPSPAVPDNPTPTPMRLAEPAPRPAPEIAPEPVPVPQHEPEPQPEPIVILQPEPIPEPVLAPEPEPAPEPSPEPSPMDIEAPDENVVDTGGGDTKPALGVYSVINQVGEGTFGKVYKVLNTQTGVHVALKRIRMETEKDGFPVTAMREVKLLQSLNHANIVRLFEMLVDSGSVYMVFEYMDHDLTGILSQTQFTFSEAHLKSLCHQMLGGLAYLHHKGVIHRDIKGSNILLNNRGELKLADFGLARFYQKRRRTDYTNRVITLWYRPPELLFGATVYGPEVDMWSAGCIMLELYTKKPVFQGNDEMHQLDTIYRIIGTPDAGRWPDIGNLPWYELVKPREAQANRFREMFSRWMSGPALDLGERLLCYDPGRRIGAAEAMEAPYFVSESPEAERPTRLASVQGEWHELETKRERAKKRKKD